jgi:hypothetical protein
MKITRILITLATGTQSTLRGSIGAAGAQRHQSRLSSHLLPLERLATLPSSRVTAAATVRSMGDRDLGAMSAQHVAGLGGKGGALFVSGLGQGGAKLMTGNSPGLSRSKSGGSGAALTRLMQGTGRLRKGAFAEGMVSGIPQDAIG